MPPGGARLAKSRLHASLEDALVAAEVDAVIVLHGPQTTHAEEWRLVRLRRQNEHSWQLLDKNCTVDGARLLDEPDTGCPAAGFSTESLISDVRMDYYEAVPTPPQDKVAEDCEAEAPKEPEVQEVPPASA